MQNTVPPPSCLFALRSSLSPFLPPFPFPFRLGRSLRLSPFLQFPASVRVRPGQKTRPRDARCFLESVRPPPRPISRRNGKARRISMSGERILRREAGWMGWLSQKLTAKIDRPVAAAVAAVVVLAPLRRRRQQRRKKSKKGAAVASLARSLASFVPSFFRRRRRRWRRLQLPCRILLRQRPDSGGRFR